MKKLHLNKILIKIKYKMDIIIQLFIYTITNTNLIYYLTNKLVI